MTKHDVVSREEYPPIEDRLYGEIIKVEVYSFGYLFGEPPKADVVLDLREVLRNPASDPRLRELTGLDPQVVEHVLNTPGAAGIGEALYQMTYAILSVRNQPAQKTITTIAIGCAGGRHRSVVFANQLMYWLRQDGIGANVTHRDILRPVVNH